MLRGQNTENGRLQGERVPWCHGLRARHILIDAWPRSQSVRNGKRRRQLAAVIPDRRRLSSSQTQRLCSRLQHQQCIRQTRSIARHGLHRQYSIPDAADK